MHFFQYFEWLCKCKGMSVPDGYKEADINKGTVSRWRSALADGIEARPSTGVALKISRFWNIPLMDVYDMKWNDGVTAEEWKARGARFRELREMSGVSDNKAATMAALSVKEVRDFEDFGVPLDVTAIYVMCSCMGIKTSDVYADSKEPSDKERMISLLQSMREEDRELLAVSLKSKPEQVLAVAALLKSFKETDGDD